jgi:hypothetical protein
MRRVLSAGMVLVVVVSVCCAQSETVKQKHWFRVNLAAQPVYEVTVTQGGGCPDLELAVLREHPDGGYSLLGRVNDWDGDETVLLGHAEEGSYLICVQSSEEAFSSEAFALTIMAPLGDGGHLLIFAEDLIELGEPPPSAQAILDGGTPVSFGTNYSLAFTSLTPGVHTVVVTVADGYLPDCNNEEEGEEDDPDSDYGNPRHLVVSEGAWEAAAFDFLPILTAEAIVRDAWTMERLTNMPIEFIATSGWITNEVYRKDPNYATYATNWVTSTNGCFPDNVYLPTVDWDLRITNACYETLYVTNAITNCSAGDEIDLGTVYMIPVDDNTNTIGDEWEEYYFGVGTNAVPGADPDEDYRTTYEEYIAGTHPTNCDSCLRLAEPEIDTSGSNGTVTLSWPTEDWRTYSLQAIDSLSTTDSWWQVTNTTWEATKGQTNMTYVDNEYDDFVRYFYRVQVVADDYVGSTNRVLHPIPTNSPGGGSSTNNPPTP